MAVRSSRQSSNLNDTSRAEEADRVPEVKQLLGIQQAAAQALASHEVSYKDCYHLDDAALSAIGIDRIGTRRRITEVGSNVTIYLQLGDMPPCRVVVTPQLKADELEHLIRGAFMDTPIDQIFGLRQLADDTLYPLPVVCQFPLALSESHAPLPGCSWGTRAIKCEVVCSVHPDAVMSWAKTWGMVAGVFVIAYLTGVLNLCWGALGSFVWGLHNMTVRTPLRRLYWGGPVFRVSGVEVGFWNGMSRANICQRLMPATSLDFWITNMVECHTMYEAKEDAFVFMAECLGIFMLLYFFRYIVMLVAIVTGHPQLASGMDY